MTLLIVDDEANIRASLGGALGREGYQVDLAASVSEGRLKLRESYDFVLLDVWFPDGSGLDLLAEIMESTPDTIVIMMSGHATVDAAVKATRLGAFDFLEKPISLERLLILLRNASEKKALQAENRRLVAPLWAHEIVGRSAAVEKLLREIQLAGPTAARVLIQGENGTGKELVARALHASSPRASQPFVAVNCSAIPEELIESELFGHERGAFTGATQSRRGRFEEAHHGTLFLDEIGDMSARAQTKLLRVLQENEITRVGGNRPIRVDVRVVAATNQDLEERVRSDRFREDLYFRLAVVPIHVPPLRERPEDVPLLVEHFAARIANESGGKPRTFSAGALDLLRRYSFPGNVRELGNIVERLWIMTRGATIGAEQVQAILPRAEGTAAAGAGARLSEAVREFERKEIEAALQSAGGSMTKAALSLGLERSHLYKKMKRLGWKPESLTS
ncbi:MAG TPA: sigma-54 dependent transcriptional regulator [Candidatus Saccharimonadales bacterium]|nr:sigma-54 dependent transcriptional regulator [Candidatus Saccharimonadales bacterium]